MRRMIGTTVALAIVMLVTLAPGVAMADGGRGVKAQPLTPQPGDVITVKGDLLGPNSEVEVRIVGSGVDVDLGAVKADAEGDFTARFRLPADLEPGTYQVLAKGTETATTEITVVARAAEPATAGAPAVSADMMPVRERPLGETIGLVALFGILAGLGLFLARTARTGTAPTAVEVGVHSGQPNAGGRGAPGSDAT